jgi:lipid-A-disaccharide synthase
MLCLFPFETQIYGEHGVAVRFVGHPLADELPLEIDSLEPRHALGLHPPGKLLALLPGSRRGEVRLLAPLFLQVARRLWEADPQLSFVLPAANEHREAELRGVLAGQPGLPVTLVSGRSREVMAASDAVLLASGTASLEAALLKRPMVVAYRMGALSWWLIRHLAITRFAALPNVLADRALVPELLQDDATVDNLATSVDSLLASGQESSDQVQAFSEIHTRLRRGYATRTADALVALCEGTLVADDG